VSALLLGLGAGFGWGISDFLGGLASRRGPLIAVLTVSQLAGLVLMFAILATATPALPSAPALGWAVLAGLAGGIGVFALYRGMAIGSISIIAPISALAVVVPVAVGLARGERPEDLEMVGIVLAIIGSVLAGKVPGKASTSGVGIAILAALGFGWGFVFIDLAAEDGAIWAFTTARAAASVAILATALMVLGIPRLAREVAVIAGAAGSIEASAGLAFALATTVGLLSVVSVLSSLYPAVTVGLAFIVLGERLGRTQWLAVSLVLVGVAAIAAG